MKQNYMQPNPLCTNCDGEGASFGPDVVGPCGCCWEYSLQPDRDVRTLDRTRLVEMAATLYDMLEQRQLCTSCGGTGRVMLNHHDGPQESVCDCWEWAAEALSQYRRDYETLVDEYLWLQGYDPSVVGRDMQAFAEMEIRKAMAKNGMADRIEDGDVSMCDVGAHEYEETYYGLRCAVCGDFLPDGQGPWVPMGGWGWE